MIVFVHYLVDVNKTLSQGVCVFCSAAELWKEHAGGTPERMDNLLIRRSCQRTMADGGSTSGCFRKKNKGLIELIDTSDLHKSNVIPMISALRASI